jgi:hypothetical protein
MSFKYFLTAICLCLLLVSAALAEVPKMINYQGKITTPAGALVDTSVQMIFTIYDDSTSGNTLWADTISSVSVQKGIFSVLLGSGNPIPDTVFDGNIRYLGTKVGTDAEMTPLKPIVSVAYAFKTGTVQSLDIVNEPGVAAFSGAYYLYLDPLTYTVICSLTINCPAKGYVMAVAHGRIGTIPHTQGIHSYAIVGISDVPTSLPGNQDLDFHVDSAAPSGKYFIPFGMTSMFEVPSAGAYTYYYLGYEFSGAITVADMQFNLVYFPTAYGKVDSVPPPVIASDGYGSIQLDGMTLIESNTKQTETEVLNVAKLERELATMKARIEAMQQQIDNNSNERREGTLK